MISRFLSEKGMNVSELKDSSFQREDGMKKFARLFHDLDQANKTNDRIDYLIKYFKTANEEDSLWVCWFLSGNRIKGAVKTSELRNFASERSGLPMWLIEECHDRVGDLAETLSLLVGKGQSKMN